MNKQALRGVGLGGVFSAIAVALVWLPAACTSSGNPGGGNPDGGGSGSGGSGSGSSSGSSSSGSSSGGTSSSGSSGSSSGSAGGGDVELTTPGATPLSIRALTLVGSNLYWIDSQGTSTASIKSVPTTGGAVTTVLADATLDQNMTTDGTLLYFTWTSATADDGDIFSPSELDSVKVDGTSRTSLVTGFSTQTASHQDPASELFLAGGNFYFVAASSLGNPQLMSAPLAGSASPATVVGYPTDGQVLDLAWADSTGVYFTLQTISTSAFDFSYVPLGSSTITTLYAGSALEYPTAGQVTVVGSTVYFGVGNDQVTFMSAPVPPAGAATALGTTIMGSTLAGMIGDALDMYVFSTGAGAGLYTLSTTTGTPTNVELDPAGGDFNGHIRALDSKNLYYGTGGSLWAHAR